MKLSSEQVSIMRHTRIKRQDQFFVGGSLDMDELVKLGLMESKGKTEFCPDEYFALTDKGKEVLYAYTGER